MKKTFYSERFKKQNVMIILYAALTAGALFFKDAPMVAWLIYWSTLLIVYCLNETSDAIYNSVCVRINLQSAWLDIKLKNIEMKIGEVSGQEEWLNQVKRLNEVTGTNVLTASHFYHDYPEKS